MAHALLDDASDTTFVAEKVLEDLGITRIEVNSSQCSEKKKFRHKI
jgi:hypothetical protein